MQQCRRTHGELSAAALEVRLREGVELAVQGCEQGVAGGRIARVGTLDHRRNLLRVSGRIRIRHTSPTADVCRHGV